MEEYRPPFADRRPLIATVLGLVFAAAVFSGLLHQERRANGDAMQVAASEMMVHAISRSEDHFRTIQRMAARLEMQDGRDRQAWFADAEQLIQDNPAIRSLTWTSPDFSSNWIVDRRGPRQLEDLEEDGVSTDALARRHSASLLPQSSGPQQTRHGGPAFHYDVPLVQPGGHAGGVLRAVMNYEDLLAPAFWDFAESYAVIVSIDGQQIYGDTPPGGTVAASAGRKVLGENWKLEILPLDPSTSVERLGIAAAAASLIALLGLITTAALHFRARSNWRALVAQSTREELQNAIDALDKPFAYFDHNDRLRHWNQAFMRLHDDYASHVRRGVTYKDLLTVAVQQSAMSADAEGRAAFITTQMARHRNGSYDTVREIADGRWLHMLERRSQNGATVTLWNDVSEQKRRELELKQQRDQLAAMQEQLRQEQDKLRAFAEVSADWLWITDQQHCYTWLSENVENYTQLPKDWHYGKSRLKLERPTVPDADWDAHVTQLESHEPFRDFTYRREAPDGDRWIRSSGMPQFDEEGNFIGYLGTGADITDLKLAERQSQTLRDRLATAIGAISEGVMLFDADDRLVICNDNFRSPNATMADAFVEGADYAEIIRRAARDTLADDITHEERESWLSKRMNLRDANQHFMEFQNREGKWCRVAEYRTDDGGTIAVRTDITDLKKRQLELIAERNRAEEASRAKSEFLANMSHELRTPLNAIIGFSDVMQTAMFGPLPDRYAGYANDIALSGRHLLSLINDLLDSAKIEAGSRELDVESVPLRDVLTQLETLAQPMIDEHGLKLEINHHAARHLVLTADIRAVRQIMLNLLSNAVKFSQTDGTINLDLDAEAGDLEIRLTDHGIGLKPDDLERVFERFVQVGDAMSRTHAGTGIGLPLSRALAELHGGTLHLENGQEGGIVAILRLPGTLSQAADEPIIAVAG